ncbi:MAG: hypothetical protein KL785_03395 [Brevundimonas sp.]|nr:hypothetical protein [Brevundimonas sp.]
MTVIAAALLFAVLGGPESTAPTADRVFAEACVAAPGDRDALRVLAESRGWVPAPLPEAEDFTRTIWADAYAVGDNTIFLAAYPAARRDPAATVSLTHPPAAFCGVLGERPADWRDSLRAIAEDQLGMTRIPPMVRRDPDGDFQTAAWQGDGWIDVQYRRENDPPFRVAWVRFQPETAQ